MNLVQLASVRTIVHKIFKIKFVGNKNRKFLFNNLVSAREEKYFKFQKDFKFVFLNDKNNIFNFLKKLKFKSSKKTYKYFLIKINHQSKRTLHYDSFHLQTATLLMNIVTK